MEEIKYLNDLKHLVEPGCAGAEIGVAAGGTSYEFLNWGILSKLYMVDVWQSFNLQGDIGNDQKWHDQNFSETKRKVSQFGEKAIILKGTSNQMARQVKPNELGFIFLDASHLYHNVLSDLNVWFPKVKKGGIISGHDYLSPVHTGVKKAVDYFCKYYKYSPLVIPQHGEDSACFYFRK